MTLSLQEISDRFEIQDLIVEYCDVIDKCEIDRLDAIFTTDAFIDYTAMGGIKGNLEEIKAYLKGVVSFFPATQHMIANSRVRVDGDTATGRTMCHNPMVFNLVNFSASKLAVAPLQYSKVTCAIEAMCEPQLFTF